DLAPRDISGTSDPFARVFWGSHSLETSTIKKTRFPHWDEVLELREAPGTMSSLRVELWDWDMVGKNDFLGMVEFTPQTLQQKPPNGWFRLLPFPRPEDSGGSLGALRLKVRLTEDRVLPSQYYQPLMEMLLESVQGPVEEDTTSPLAVLEELASGDCRQDLATKLVKLFLGRGLAGPFLDYLTRREVARTNDPNTLFRSNSLASKSMEQFMKLVGMRYLHEVLRPVVSRVFEEKKYMELDPCKMELNRSRRISFKGTPTEEQVRETSLGLLTGYLGSIVDAIVSSAGRCPLALRLAFKQLQRCVEKRFPGVEHQDAKYLATSGFLFLRFFAPAILTPKLFDLRDQHADPQTSRSLLLLAKVHSSIPVSCIRAVERVDEGAFQLPHVMQVVTQDGTRVPHTTYLQCKNVNDLNQWLSALRKASAPNQDKLTACHPGAFRSGRWTCCLQTERTEWYYWLKLLEDSSLDTDPELGPGKDSGATDETCTEVLAQQRAAITHLLQVLEDLEQAHEEFQKRGQGQVVL
ncbi:rasGAP-activating-like protein 1, partial [Cricetulus griseus]